MQLLWNVKFFQQQHDAYIPNLRSICNFRLLGLEYSTEKKKSTCIVERKPLQNRKPFCPHTCHAWARESKQEPGRFAKAEQLYIGKDWRMFLQELWGQATQGPLGHAQTLCCNRDHVESPLIWRETDRLKIEWLEIIYYDLSNSFYSERWNLLKSFPPGIPRNDIHRTKIIIIGGRCDF